MPELDLAPIEARVDALPEADWPIDAENCDCGDGYACGHGACVIAVGPIEIESIRGEKTAEVVAFASRAPGDVRALLGEVKRLRALEEQVLALADRSKVARDEWIEQCAELGIDPGTVVQAATEQRAQAEVVVTPTIAAHVLFHYGEGGYEAGGFTSNLIGLITRADPQRRALLGLSFPGYVTAVTLADRTTDGIAVLQKIAGSAGG